MRLAREDRLLPVFDTKIKGSIFNLPPLHVNDGSSIVRSISGYFNKASLRASLSIGECNARGATSSSGSGHTCLHPRALARERILRRGRAPLGRLIARTKCATPGGDLYGHVGREPASPRATKARHASLPSTWPRKQKSIRSSNERARQSHRARLLKTSRQLLPPCTGKEANDSGTARRDASKTSRQQ